MKASMLTLRVTSEEKKILEEKAKENALTVSQYIRAKLNIYDMNNTDNIEILEICPLIICNIFTEIQKLQQKYPEINTDELEEGAERLWRK